MSYNGVIVPIQNVSHRIPQKVHKLGDIKGKCYKISKNDMFRM